MEILVITVSEAKLNGKIIDLPYCAQTFQCKELNLQRFSKKILARAINKDIKFIHILKKIKPGQYMILFTVENKDFEYNDKIAIVEKCGDFEIIKEGLEEELKGKLN